MSTPPAPFGAAAVEMVCRVLAEAVTGSQIPNLIAPLKVSEPPGDDRNTKWKRLFNAVATAQNRQGDGRPLIRLISEVMQPVRSSSTAEFDSQRAMLNERLLLSGLQIREDGKVARVTPARTLAEAQARANAVQGELTRRGVHPDVLHFCLAELMHENYFHAVLEACKSVAEKLRVLTGLDGDGASLVDAACLGKPVPIVMFNALETTSERSEQTGLATLMKGLFGTFRNPTAHAPKVLWATDEREALDMMTLASMLHRRLDAATIQRPG